MWTWLLIKAALFYALVPGVLVRLPSRESSLRTQAFVHGVIAAVLLYFIYRFTNVVEMMTNPSTKSDSPCPPGSRKCPSGDCVLEGDKHSPCH
jgi:hypothetical protein